MIYNPSIKVSTFILGYCWFHPWPSGFRNFTKTLLKGKSSPETMVFPMKTIGLSDQSRPVRPQQIPLGWTLEPVRPRLVAFQTSAISWPWCSGMSTQRETPNRPLTPAALLGAAKPNQLITALVGYIVGNKAHCMGDNMISMYTLRRKTRSLYIIDYHSVCIYIYIDGLSNCCLVWLINRNSLRAASCLVFRTRTYRSSLKPCISSFMFETVAKTCSKF